MASEHEGMTKLKSFDEADSKHRSQRRPVGDFDAQGFRAEDTLAITEGSARLMLSIA